MSKELIEKLFLPDGSAYALSSAMAARSGSGKTTLLTRLIHDSRTNPKFKETRFIYISVKEEHLFGGDVEPTADIGEALKSMTENRLTVFYPIDSEYYETDVDSIIEGVFKIAGQKRKKKDPIPSFVIIIDDANILKGFDSRGQPSPMVKKLAIAGRSKRIRGMFITHRLGNLPRIMNGNLSSLVIMNINPMDNEYARKIFGIDFESIVDGLGEFRWAYVDLLDESIHKYNPIEPVEYKPKPKKKSKRFGVFS
tara:strand:+ start:3613 stop:4371 length:759 start_codon:yes stop_codon:yes gene_type:complete